MLKSAQRFEGWLLVTARGVRQQHRLLLRPPRCLHLFLAMWTRTEQVAEEGPLRAGQRPADAAGCGGVGGSLRKQVGYLSAVRRKELHARHLRLQRDQMPPGAIGAQPPPPELREALVELGQGMELAG